MKYLLFITCLLFVRESFGQLTQRPSDLQNVIPPSPNASSLGKYADWPVSLYTGVPDINIPLYELKGRSISVPVSLSYHASGIKVGEVASSVGLGWCLNGGGVITRSVRGLPDEAGGVGYTAIKSYYNNPGDLSSGTLTNAAVSDSLNIVHAAAGTADSEPDLYMFNALGRSFKFYFAGNGTVVTQPSSAIIIKTHFQDNTWLVTMEDGTKLVFGGSAAVETTTSTRAMVQSSDMPSFISAWYLKSIITATDEVINFTYETSTINQDATYYQVDYLLLYAQKTNCATATPVKVPYQYFETQAVSMLNLSSIESDLGKVVFINDTTGRVDLRGGKVLNEMDVYTKPANKLIHKFTFSHSYSQAVTGNSYTTPNSTQSKYRLKLNSIQEVPVDNTSPKIWGFAYNPLTLPSRQSYAQDHWGYYNGALSNATLLPSVPGFDNPSLYVSGNRNGDSTSMAAEMLTQITYPTGGVSKFSFEPNSVLTTRDKQVSQSSNINLYLTANQSPFSNTKTQTFTTTQGQYINLVINASFSTSITNDYGPSVTIASVSILNSSQTVVSNFDISGSKLTAGHYNLSKNIDLSSGTYTFKISSISQSSDFVTSSDLVSIQGGLTYTGSAGILPYNRPVGGLRIKTIIDSAANSIPVQRNFKYENPNVVAFDPVYDYVASSMDNIYDDNGTCTSTTPVSSSTTYSPNPEGTSGSNTNYDPTIVYPYPGKQPSGTGSGGNTNCFNVTVITFNFDGSTTTTTEPRCTDNQTYQKHPADTIYYAANNSGPNNKNDLTTDDPELRTNAQVNSAFSGIPGMLIASYQYAARNSSVKCALGSIQGGTVGYGKVTTTYGPTGGNGYTVSYFSQAADLNIPSSKVLPYPPIVPLDWQKGLLLNEITYNNTNVPLKKISNSYNFVNQQSINTFKAAPLFNTPSLKYPKGLLGSFISKIYFTIITQQVQKASSTDVNYYNNGADSVVTVTNYFFDNPINFEPTRVEANNSRGENLKTISRTALEKSDINTSIPLSAPASLAIDTMVARNMISLPIETETYNNNVLRSKVITNYSLFNNHVLPQEVKTQDGSNTIQSRMLLNNYDTYGNLLEQQKTAGSLNNYIWDYQSTYPVAAVVNGSQTEIAFAGFESSGSGNWTIASPLRDSVTVAFTGRKSYVLSNGTISKSGLTSTKTYVVSYWRKSTTALTITGTITGYPITGPTRNGWTYFEHYITGQTAVNITGSGNIDDVRLYPLGAQMTTFTYDPLVGVTSSTDTKGLTTYYEYDSLQRLMNIKDKDGNIVKHTDYHYQQ